MSKDNSISNQNPVLRVTQLDTAELDEALIVNLKHSFNTECFKYLNHTFLREYHVEILTAIKFVLWYNTYYKNGQTVGQSILDWSYHNAYNSKLKKIVHGLIYCLNDWFDERFPDIFKRLLKLVTPRALNSNQTFNQVVDSYLNKARLILKIISYFNYLTFIFNGKFLHLWERALGLRPVFKKKQHMRSYNTEISAREELWQTFFSLFKLVDSLFSFKRLYSKLRKFYSLKVNADKTEIAKVVQNDNLCSICDNEPTLVHASVKYDDFSSCKHIFCYACIKKELNENKNKYSCKKCSKIIYDIELFTKNHQ